MPFAPRTFEEQLQVTLETLDQVTTRDGWFDACADEVTRLTLTWGESHWDEIVEAALTYPLLGRGLGSAHVPHERFQDSLRLLRQLGVDRDLVITIRVTEDGPLNDVGYHLANVRINDDFPLAVLERVTEDVPPHLGVHLNRMVRIRRGTPEAPG